MPLSRFKWFYFTSASKDVSGTLRGQLCAFYPRGVGERRRGWKPLITTKWYIAVKPAKIPLSPVSCEDTSGLIPSAIPETRSMQSPFHCASRKAVTASLYSKQLLPFGLAQQSCSRSTHKKGFSD